METRTKMADEAVGILTAKAEEQTAKSPIIPSVRAIVGGGGGRSVDSEPDSEGQRVIRLGRNATLADMRSAVEQAGEGGPGETDRGTDDVDRRPVFCMNIKTATVGDLQRAVEQAGQSFFEFRLAARADQSGPVYSFWTRVGAEPPTASLSDVLRRNGKASAELVFACTKASTECKVVLELIDGGSQEDEGEEQDRENEPGEKNWKDEEAAEEEQPKTRVVLASKIMGGTEIVEAVEASDVDFDDLVYDLAEADDVVPGAAALARALEESRTERRAAGDEDSPVLPVLQEHASVINALNRSPDFPYIIEFVFHDDDEEAEKRLSPEQIWYQCGQNERNAGKKHRPPTICSDDPLTRAYKCGWQGRERGAFFPEEAADGKTGEENQMQTVTLGPRFTLTCRQFIDGFPGGPDELRRLLDEGGVSFGDLNDLFDPVFKPSTLNSFLPPSRYDARWFATIGVRFAEPEEAESGEDE